MDECGNLKVDEALAYQQPVQQTEHRRSVVTTPSTNNQPSSGVLNRPQPAHQSLRDAEEQRVAVVQATGDKCLD